MLTVFRFFLPLLIFFTTTVFSQAVDSSNTVRTERLESTLVLLKDSVRLQTLINEVEGILEAEKQAASKSHIKDISVAGTIVKADSLLLFNSITAFSKRLRNVYRELINSLDVIVKPRNLIIFNNRRDGMLFLLFIVIALISGSVVWWLVRRMSLKFKAGSQNNSPSRFSGYMFLFFSRFASGGGISTVLLLVYFSIGKNSVGMQLYQLAFAVAVYASLSSVVQVFFSKKYPQFRVVPLLSAQTDLILKLLSSILVIGFLFWFLYSVTLSLNWVSTPVMIAAVYKVILTFQLTFLAYQLQKAVKKGDTNTGAGTIQKLILAIAGFTGRKMYLILFVACTVLTVSSLVDDQTMYRYLFTSMLYTVLLGFCLTLLYWMLIKLLKHVGNLNNDSQKASTYFDQFLAANVNSIGWGGFIFISVAGLIILVRIWGLNIFRISQTDIPLVAAIVHIIAIIVAALIILQLTQLLIKGLQANAAKNMVRSGTSEIEIKKRLDTLGGIFQKISGTTISVIAVVMIVDELGFDIKAMLAGLGIVGLAVGFGAQNLVRDIISGLFVIFENRIRVGDVAIINGTGGLVEQVNLRTVVLRSQDGTIHVFSNGTINSLSNMTHEYSYYVFDIGVAYNENVDHVIKVLKSAGESILEDERYRQSILEPLEILGLDKFGSSEIIIKARIKTVPIKQWEIGREMNRRIKIAFDKEGIEIPYPHRSFYFGEHSKPVSVKIEGFPQVFSGNENLESRI
ncbi:MAG: mechanosensitive ion channel family protein [Chitinispirillaceae bacterium]|nr:mechanosensitive ion channel family protein [Chitinispirillaceae bacterium]